MKITIVAMGSRGDVEPYIALGKGLKRAGHEVYMPVSEIFKEMVLNAGLIYFPIIGVDPKSFLRSKNIVEARKKKSNVGFLMEMFKKIRPLAESYYKQIWEACKGSDAIVSAFLYLFAYDSAEKLNIPCIQSVLYPLYPTGEFPSIMIPFDTKNKRFNRFTHTLIWASLWGFAKKEINKARKELLELNPYGFFGPYKKLAQDKSPILLAFSPHVIPRPSDWVNKWMITGYFFNDDYEDYDPPEDLVNFINSGLKPVYIGFGSMTDNKPAKTTEMILEGLKLSGQRGIISIGWAGIGNYNLPDSVFLVDNVPHSWLFKNVSATVIHGGAGTAAASMRAGVPTIITPFLGDQFYWGRQLHKLGVSPKPINFNKLTSERLADLIKTALTDEDMKMRAKELGEKINSEDGVGNAVEIINNYLDSIS